MPTRPIPAPARRRPAVLPLPAAPPLFRTPVATAVASLKTRGVPENEQETIRTLPPVPCDNSWCAVETMVGFTENLGDMNFCKVHVMVHMPCANTPEARFAAGRMAYEEADMMVEEFHDRLMAAPKK